MQSSPIEQARFNMIEQQIRPAISCSQRVLELLQLMPRERFVPSHYQSLAFADTELPLAQGGQMATPRMEAAMLNALNLGLADSVLEIGTSTGFLTACMAHMAGYVTSLDHSADNIDRARERLAAQGITNVSLIEAGIDQLPNGAFDAILVSGGSLASRHQALEAKLTQGGRLFAVIGETEPMQACLIRRTAADRWESQVLFETWLAPLVMGAPRPHFVF